MLSLIRDGIMKVSWFLRSILLCFVFFLCETWMLIRGDRNTVIFRAKEITFSRKSLAMILCALARCGGLVCNQLKIKACLLPWKMQIKLRFCWFFSSGLSKCVRGSHWESTLLCCCYFARGKETVRGKCDISLNAREPDLMERNIDIYFS